MSLGLLAAVGFVAVDGGWNTATVIGAAFLFAAGLLSLPAAVQPMREPRAERAVVLNDSLVAEVRTLKRRGDRDYAAELVRDRTGLNRHEAAQLVELTR